MHLNETDKVYHDLLKDILENGHQKGDRTGTGTLSVYGRQIRFNLKNGFPMISTKKLHTRSILHELLWFLKGDTNIKYLNENGVTIWDEWADENGDLGPVYGKQWVDWSTNKKINVEVGTYPNGERMYETKYKGINQIENAVNRLKEAPDCRRILVTALNPSDLPDMKLPPCHYGFQLWSRELSAIERENHYAKINNYSADERMEMNPNATDEDVHEIMDADGIPRRELSLRSVDTFLGLPFNIASYAFLLEMIAQQTNMVAGELIGNLGDTHLYSNHIEYVEKQLVRESHVGSGAVLHLKKAKDIFSYSFEDFEIRGYTSHPNWKGVPIAV